MSRTKIFFSSERFFTGMQIDYAINNTSLNLQCKPESAPSNVEKHKVVAESPQGLQLSLFIERTEKSFLLPYAELLITG